MSNQTIELPDYIKKQLSPTDAANNRFHKCIFCVRIQNCCPHVHLEPPDDGTMCPHGMTRERNQTADIRPQTAASDSSSNKKTSKSKGKVVWTEERKAELSRKAKERWAAMNPEEQRLRVAMMRGKK